LKKWMTIAELGRHSGVGVETVRYYQRLGLLRVPDGSPRSHRRYGADAVDELAFVRHCKSLGFRLKDIGSLVQLRRTQNVTCTRVHAHLSELHADLVTKRQQLEEQLSAVKGLLETCPGDQPLPDCEAFSRLGRGPVGSG
jgi:MerR family mercuric resistance operon transcriptional regulator